MRSRKIFAVPLVITVACSGKNEQKEERACCVNPPEPVRTSDAASRPTENPPAPRGIGWQVERAGSGSDCQAVQMIECPTAPNGAIAPCNPPEPVRYACKDIAPPFVIDQIGEVCTHTKTDGKIVDVECPT